jgi:Domain of Unknown Function with PDB structure (DUF3861)
MNSYRYRITVEKLADANGDAVQGQSFSFYAANHDDIFAIVNRLQGRLKFDAGTAASLGVGLKLLSEVALIHRKNPIFEAIRPALGEFTQQLRQQTVMAGAD